MISPTVLAGAAGLAALALALPLAVAVDGLGPAAASTAAAGAVGGSCTVTVAHGQGVWLDAGQMDNARAIARAAADAGLPDHAAAIALIAALEDSSLRTLNHGDIAGPTSRGLFQQQPAFHPGLDIADPAAAAAAFYARLALVRGWPTMPAWQAAHAVQPSADPGRYRRWQAVGEALAAALDGRLTGAVSCTPGDPAAGPGASAGGRIAAVLAAAVSQLGRPYVWGGGDADGPTGGVDAVSPPGYDCSGLVIYAWARAGVSLPHSSRQQYQAGRHIPVSQALPGDLIFLAANPGDPASIHHVALLYAPGQIIEAQTFGVPVHIRQFAGGAEPGIMPTAVRLAP